MSKVSIVYWSGTGNTAMMAGSIADGVAAAGGEAELITVDEASVDALKDASVIALGCPSMGAEQLEETQMEPFMCELDGVIAGSRLHCLALTAGEIKSGCVTGRIVSLQMAQLL